MSSTNLVLSPPAFHSAPARSRICIHWQKGICTKGSDCQFAHGAHELSAVQATRVGHWSIGWYLNAGLWDGKDFLEGDVFSCRLRWRAMKDSRYDAVWLLAGLPYWNYWCKGDLWSGCLASWLWVWWIFVAFNFAGDSCDPANVGLWRGRFTKAKARQGTPPDDTTPEVFHCGIVKQWLVVKCDGWLCRSPSGSPFNMVFVRKSWSQTSHVDSFWTLFFFSKQNCRDVWRVLIRKM